MVKVAEAQEATRTAQAALEIVQKRVKDVEDQCQALDDKLNNAVTDKENVEMQATNWCRKTCMFIFLF